MTSVSSRGAPERRTSFWYWVMFALALVIMVSGVVIFLGGIWLLSLGGSFYYAIAGAGLIATAALMMLRSILAVWVYLLTYVFTLIWAFWEVGLDGWAQVPRLVGPTVVLVLVLLCIPILIAKPRERRHP